MSGHGLWLGGYRGGGSQFPPPLPGVWGGRLSRCRPCRHTAKAADVVLLGGDLNMHPQDVGIRLLRCWTGLRDAFTETKHFEVSGTG